MKLLSQPCSVGVSGAPGNEPGRPLCAAVANPINKPGSLTSPPASMCLQMGQMTISLKLGFPGFVKTDNSNVLQLCSGCVYFPVFTVVCLKE